MSAAHMMCACCKSLPLSVYVMAVQHGAFVWLTSYGLYTAFASGRLSDFSRWEVVSELHQGVGLLSTASGLLGVEFDPISQTLRSSRVPMTHDKLTTASANASLVDSLIDSDPVLNGYIDHVVTELAESRDDVHVKHEDNGDQPREITADHFDLQKRVAPAPTTEESAQSQGPSKDSESHSASPVPDVRTGTDAKVRRSCRCQ